MTSKRKHDPVLADQGGRDMPVDPADPVNIVTETMIRDRAYQLFETRGAQEGQAEQDWPQAEEELLSNSGL